MERSQAPPHSAAPQGAALKLKAVRLPFIRDAILDKLRIEIIPTDQLPNHLRIQILDWLVTAFIDDKDDTVWAEPDWHFLGWFSDQLVSHLDIVEREVLIEGNKFLAAGIGGVITIQAYQGRGFGTSMMESAHNFMANNLDCDFGLLMCDEHVVPFYQKLGWILVSSTLEYDQPDNKKKFDDQVMVFAMKDVEILEGVIDIQGFPW